MISTINRFTDKLHIIRDKSRIRQLGSGSNDGNTDTPKDDSNENNFDKMLNNNGLQLVYEIKYDEADSTIDTIYKSFEYKLFRNHHDINNDEFKQNIMNFINDEENEEFLNENITNWSQCKDNNDLLTDKDYLTILSHFCKLNVIVYGYDKFDSNDDIDIDNDLQIIFEQKYSEINDSKDDNNIRLLYISKTKQYKLMGLTMHAITKLIHNQHDMDQDENQNENNQQIQDYRDWNVDQILYWLNIIEYGLFKDNKYDDLREGIQKLEINGANVGKINDLTLRSLGINDEFDVKLLMESITSLIATKKNKENNNNNNSSSSKNNNDIIEEEQDIIDNNLEGGYITPGGDGSTDYVGFISGKQQEQGRGTMNIGSDYFEIPEEYLDPIHYTIMKDPVLSIVSGHTFERESITEWINSNGTDPINQKSLNIHQLVPNRTLREAIDRFVKIYGSTENTETKR